ncbi:MAG: phosphomannomutase/phosphoglucomutase [Propionibacteriaceae bacterium]
MLKSNIFKANDIRGLAGGGDAEWDCDGARALGASFVEVLELTGKSFVMGRDMRVTGVELSQAFAEGACAAGANVIDIGLCSTDGLYFASGHEHVPGIMFTASHNPATYNGIKFCNIDAAPIKPEQMLAIAKGAQAGVQTIADVPGKYLAKDLLGAYAAHLHKCVDLSRIRHLKVVVDAGNGMAGYTTPEVLGALDVEIVPLFLELDGTFPNHQPNPLEPENLVDAQRAVKESGADCALVFDGDADRCFIIDERGAVVSPSIVTALIAERELVREPGGWIVVNTITSQVVSEVVATAGGNLDVSRVGHTSVKAHMADRNAIFGGEHSAHYYFRDFFFADTGMLAALHVLATLGKQEKPLSQLTQGYERYVASGEINSTVLDTKAAMDRVVAGFVGRGVVSWEDGLRISDTDAGWFVSVRVSNTEPLLRLNVEAKDHNTMAELRDLALGLIRQEIA